jgi:succinate dehydrogenase / fumarate reductase iron-sulfur subunit
MPTTATFRIWRGDAQHGQFEDYSTSVSEGMVVLDAVHQIQAQTANDLAVRWNCKAGKCGSCSAEVNGNPRLMCMTRLNQLDLTKTVTLEPMRAFPLIRDLVTDVSWNFQAKKSIKRFKPRPPDAPDGTWRHLVYTAALEMHPLDTEERARDLKNTHGVGYCNITKCCTRVCPEHITITDNAIIPLKERVIDQLYDPVAKLFRLMRA